MQKTQKNTVVLAYSGGLDTSAIIPWIKENYSYEVIAFVANIGQSEKDLIDIKKKAIYSGAKQCYIYDLRYDFVTKYIYPMLKTGALYEKQYLLGTALARPVIAKAQVELALKTNSIALCHGATGKGNDQIRFEMAYAALAPKLKIIAPWREWKISSREELITYLKNKNIPTTTTVEKIYSKDENCWHISTEGGQLEDPWKEPNIDCWSWTKDPKKTSSNPEKVLISIQNGEIIKINNKKLNPLECLNLLNSIGSHHGIGRVDIVENRLIGIKSRGCYETPGGTIMNIAIRAIEQLVLDRESFKWREQIGLEMSYVIYDGRWFTPLRQSLQSAANSLSNVINGEVVLELYKGNVIPIQKKSHNSLYLKKYATFSQDDIYNQKDAQGFINLYSISSRIRSLNKIKLENK
ncbi:Argininosuccinate synthase [Buchnera aphidicola (Anoecia corni)]|uniref:Argininosuccinate synthase n=1 Tax=Buchnera aphidicola (Anoecia corni) TaxID=2994477 RepID=A0AAT9IFX8_9GAMM